jgi:predicted membrane-bound spermidine synthase
MGSRYFSLITGIVFLLVGILGFIPNLVVPVEAPDLAVNAGYGYLLGLFPVNILHNIVHLTVGVLGIASYPDFPRARLFARGLAIFYGLLTIMGLIPNVAVNTTFGLIPIFSNDVWLHALTAVIGAFVGFYTPPISAEEQARQQEMASTPRNT